MPEVHIIILNWNGWQDTVECVRSCQRLNYGNFRLLVVDNASSDRSEAILREEFPDLEFLQAGANLGYAGGNNAGIRRAMAKGADYVWLLNNDTVVDPNALSEMVPVAEADTSVGMIGPKILLHSQPDHLNCIGSTIDLRTGQPRLLALGEKDDGRFDEIAEMDTLSGCSLLVRSALVERVGLLDDRFFLFYEETDWILRAKKAGFKMLYVPKARIWHKVSASVGGHQSPLMLYYMIRNNALLMRKNVGRGSYLLFLVIFLLLVIPKKLINVLLLNSERRIQKARAILTGLCHFFAGRFGQYTPR
ncbi:glycosyltransferase family 2 protein [Geomonas sp.]|uniref:glycosyltransferase family 2 protein n=1 Tax=Geomonas sp. TaxID=2651584 RepID=UPI002B486A83|nr:glycosyltransferase family 2 protein [Geomonas sp.]HJV36720.1 glycosyltransferase family 2 protein [Geomonas sp.]